MLDVAVRTVIAVVTAFAYYKLIQPPVNWISYMIITLTYVTNCFIIIGFNYIIVTLRPPVSLTTLQLLRQYVPISVSIIYVILLTILSVIQYNFDYNIAAYTTIVSVICISVFSVKFLIKTPETYNNIEDRSKYLNSILDLWETGNFSDVYTRTRDCSHREISELTSKIIYRFGKNEGKLFQKLL